MHRRFIRESGPITGAQFQNYSSEELAAENHMAAKCWVASAVERCGKNNGDDIAPEKIEKALLTAFQKFDASFAQLTFPSDKLAHATHLVILQSVANAIDALVSDKSEGFKKCYNNTLKEFDKIPLVLPLVRETLDTVAVQLEIDVQPPSNNRQRSNHRRVSSFSGTDGRSQR